MTKTFSISSTMPPSYVKYYSFEPALHSLIFIFYYSLGRSKLNFAWKQFFFKNKFSLLHIPNLYIHMYNYLFGNTYYGTYSNINPKETISLWIQNYSNLIFVQILYQVKVTCLFSVQVKRVKGNSILKKNIKFIKQH